MRRALRISAWLLGSLLLLSALLGLAVYVAGNTVQGRAMIERTLLRITAGHVKLTALAGSFPESLTLGKLELRDDRGIWLTAERLAVDWSPLALLARRVQIESLHVAHIALQRLPESSAKARRTDTVAIPRIDAGHVAIDLLDLSPCLAGAPASLVLDGSAHMRSVEDMVIDASARRINGDGQYELHLRFDPKRMDASLNLHEPAGGPLENLLQLPGLGPLAATLTLNGPRAAERLDLSLDAGAFRGRAQGAVNVTLLAADLDFDFESPALNPRPDLSWERATLKGRWHGDLKTPTADGHLEIAKLSLPGGTQTALVAADVSALRGQAVLRARVDALRIPGPYSALLQDSPVTIDASMQLDTPTRPLQLSAAHRLFSLKAHAETKRSARGERRAVANLQLLNLQALTAITRQDVSGTATINARFTDNGNSIRLALDGGAVLAGAEPWLAVVGARPTLQLAGVLTDEAVDIEKLKLSGVAMSFVASGKASRPAAGLRFRWDGDVTDLAKLSSVLSGSARGSGTIEGPVNALSGAAQVTATLSVRGSPNSTLSADVTMRGLPSAPSGSLAVHGDLDGAPLLVDVALERTLGTSVHVLVKRATWKSGHAQGDMSFTTANAQTSAQANGQLRLQIDRLSDLHDLLGIDVGGSLEGTVVLNPLRGRTHVVMRVAAHDLAGAGLTGSIHATGDGFTDALRLGLDVRVANLGGGAASLTAAGSLNLDARELRVTDATAILRGQEVRLLSPATLAFAHGLSIDLLKLGAQRAVFQAGGEISPVLDVSASLREVQPSLVNAFAPGLLESGTITGKARLKGNLASPTGELRLDAKRMRMASDAAFGLPAFDLRTAAQLMGNAADIDAQLSAGRASTLTLLGRAPLSREGALDLKINGGLDVGMFNSLLEARGQRATGQLAIDATVGGSISAPEIAGTVKLTHGSLRDYGRGVSVTDIVADIVGSHGGLQIQTFTAKAAPGTLSMTGFVGVLQAGMPVDLRLKAVNAQPVASKLVTSNIDADLHAFGRAVERIDIAGTIHLNRTLIGIPNSLPPNVAVLDVRRRGKAALAARGKPLVVGLDVAIQAPQEILVQGRGLDAEVGGELHVSGTTDEPFVSGGFDLQRGSFSLAGNKLNFTAGRVSFDGAGLKNKIDPTLDFTAQTSLPDATATMHITGPADAPQFEFSSTPALPQDDIMAQLLFGKRADQLSALQFAQIGAALATLSGVGGDGGLNPLVKLQRSLGLDRLTVASSTNSTGAGPDTTGASIEAGRYISKHVYVEAKQSTTGFTQLEADIELTRHLKLQTRLGNGTASVQGTTPENDPGSSIGLSYQFEY